MKKRNKGIEIACIFVAVIMMTSGCKATAVGTENSVPIETSALASVAETTKEPTETAGATTTAKPTQKVTATPTPTVEETTAATTTKATETSAPAETTKETAKPTTKPTKTTTAATAAPTETAAPAETAAPPVETAAPVATTAAPATDYTAMCADIRSKLIATLEANGQWDPNFTGTVSGWGQKWWEVGYFEDYSMSTQDVANEYYTYKFSGSTKIACGIDCYVADGKIYLDYQSFEPA